MIYAQRIKSLPQDYWTRWRYFAYGALSALLMYRAVLPAIEPPSNYVESARPVSFQNKIPYILELKRSGGSRTSLYILDNGTYIPLDKFKQKKIDSIESEKNRSIDSIESRIKW